MCLGLAGVAQAQVKEPVDLDMVSKIRQEAFHRSQVMQSFGYLTEQIGPRLTNSPGMARANEWTRDTMTKWGLQNARLESWGPFGRGWAVKKYSAAVIDPQFISVISYPRAWSPATKGMVTGEVVFIEAKTADEMAK